MGRITEADFKVLLMALANKSFHWLQNADGTFDGHYPDGDKPPAPVDIAWAPTGYPSLDGLVTNNAYSEEIRVAHLTGTDAGAATLSLDQVSGDNYATENWAMTGDNLTHPSNADAGTGVFRHKAVSGATTVYSPNRSWTYAASPGLAIKWNPGHYVFIQANIHLPSYPSITSWINEIAAMVAKPKGIHIRVFWGEHETSKNVYKFDGTGGGHNLDATFAACKANGLRMMIHVMNYRSGSVKSELVPNYLASEPGVLGGGCQWFGATKNYLRVRLDDPVTMTRYMAFITALGNHFDSDPKFERVSLTHDSITQVAGVPADFTGFTEYAVQIKRLIALGKVAFPTTSVYMGLDYGFADPSDLEPIVAYMAANRCGITSPDSHDTDTLHPWDPPNKIFHGMRVYLGYRWNGAGWVAGGVNYTGVIPASFEMGHGAYTDTAALYYDHAKNNLVTGHMLWGRNTTTDLAGFTTLWWDNTQGYANTPRQSPDIKTYMLTAGATAITKPSSYGSIVTGG